MHIPGIPAHPAGQSSKFQGAQEGAGETPKTAPPPTSPTPTPDPVDVTTLSKEAAALLADESGETRGKSAASPAHQAKAMMDDPSLDYSGKNFGQLVSRLAREQGTDKLFKDLSASEGEGDGAPAAIAAVEPDGEETPPTDDGATPPPEIDPNIVDPLIDLFTPLVDPPVDPLADPIDESGDETV